MSGSLELVRAIAVLPCLDIPRAIEFYGERLGFGALFRFDTHAAVVRDGAEIHLRLVKDKELPKSSGCRVEVRGIDSLFEEYSKAKVLAPKSTLEGQAAGAREFSVVDGDGNTISFVEDAFGA